jgi:small subunit ribosomal protein S3
MIIGRGGSGIEELKKNVEKIAVGKTISINIEEVKVAELSAQLVAEAIAAQLEKRVSFRRAMKQAIQRTMRFGAKGIKTAVSGRLGGADMARTEGYNEGTIPLQTLRADIDYGFAEATTTYGKTGVKVWIYKGEVLPTKKTERVQVNAE